MGLLEWLNQFIEPDASKSDPESVATYSFLESEALKRVTGFEELSNRWDSAYRTEKDPQVAYDYRMKARQLRKHSVHAQQRVDRYRQITEHDGNPLFDFDLSD